MNRRAAFTWTAGLLASVSYFFYFEIPALSNDVDGDTLSEFIWWLLSVPGVKYAVGLVIAFLALWLPVHWLGKGKHDKPVSSFLKRIFTRRSE